MSHFDIRALLDDSLLESLDLQQLVPASLAEGSVAVVLPFTHLENGGERDGVLKVLKAG